MLTIQDVDVSLKKLKLKPTEIVGEERKSEDSLGYAWADTNEIPIKEFKVDWNDISNCKSPKKNKWGKMYNPQAAFERNANMVKNADALLVFWDDTANGVEQIIAEAKKAGIPVYFAKPNPEYVVE